MAELPIVRTQPLSESASVFGPPPSPAAEAGLHELRVRIPVDLHRQLLSLKILRGKSLAETVALALDIYFEARKQPEESSDD